MTENEKEKRPEQGKSLERELRNGMIRAVEGQERTVELSFSSEEPYSRWWGVEILDHTNGCVDLNRLNEIGCVLFNHNRDKVIGRILEASNENGRCTATVRFDDDEQSDIIYKKVQGGTLKGVSVGYMVDSWEEVAPGKQSADGRFTGPCEIAKRWTPYEISIVSVPADPTVGVGRDMENCDVANKGRMRDIYSRQLQINKNRMRKGAMV